jgi:hypothetical protein
MAKKYVRPKHYSLIVQEEELKKTYGPIIKSCSINRSHLYCTMCLRPSNESIVYTVRIEYSISGVPKVWLIDPEMECVDGKLPHHIYRADEDNEGHQRLCVYYPRFYEWDGRNMLLSETFVPWIITWLNTYEYWQVTGEWIYAESPIKMKKNEK